MTIDSLVVEMRPDCEQIEETSLMSTMCFSVAMRAAQLRQLKRCDRATQEYLRLSDVKLASD